jgi:hypothetical protein
MKHDIADLEARDIRFGHDLNRLQDQNGVDLSLLKANLAQSVEERLLALEDYTRFAEAVRPARDS